MIEIRSLDVRLEQLDLELEAFDDPEYAALIAKFGNTGFEDLQHS